MELPQYRRREQVVRARQAAIQDFFTELPPGVVQGLEGFDFVVPQAGTEFGQRIPVFEGHWLIYDELGTPQNVVTHDFFERHYEPFDPQQPSPSVQLAELTADTQSLRRVMAQMREEIINLNTEVDRERQRLYGAQRTIAHVLALPPQHARDDGQRVIVLDVPTVERLRQYSQ